MDTIYYYKTFDGCFRFSTGVTHDDQDVPQYLRTLRNSGCEVERLYPDVPRDFAKICEVFGYSRNTDWRQIYHDCAE